MLVITSQKEVGTFLGFPVFRVMSMKFLACNGALRFATSQEVRFGSLISEKFTEIYREIIVCFHINQGMMHFMQKKDEAYFMNLLRTVEATPGLYYSYETDITLK